MELNGMELSGWRTSSYTNNGGNTCVEVCSAPWRTSSYTANGGNTCVDVGSAPWRTSSYSSNGGDTCVEAAAVGRVIAVRDTTDRGAGLTLAFTAAAWTAFTASLK
jgi:hypothetical protein